MLVGTQIKRVLTKTFCEVCAQRFIKAYTLKKFATAWQKLLQTVRIKFCLQNLFYKRSCDQHGKRKV